MTGNVTVNQLNFRNRRQVVAEKSNIEDNKLEVEEKVADELEEPEVSREANKIELSTHEFNSHTCSYVVEMIKGKKPKSLNLHNSPDVRNSHNFCVDCGCPITKRAKRCPECEGKRKRDNRLKTGKFSKK